MNSFFRFGFFLLISLLPSVASSNNPCSAISVPNNGVLFNTYNLSAQAASGVEPPPCGTYNDPDMWFSFVAPAGGSVTIEVKGITANDPAMAIYSGNCGAPQLEGCYDDQQCGNNPNPGVSLTGLIVGATYYIRVWNEAGGGGTFKMRILNLNQSNFTNQFNAFNTAPNCVQLTAAANSQKGCSWYNAPLDFDEAFELEFDLYFGNNDAGADGICLVFSTNQNCGDVGGGIGASGIPNSVIVEFDTWDNGIVGFDDIPDDHTSIHINGDFTSSIAGPVGLGNIEDGQSHQARILWDPLTMTLSVIFDGAPVLQLAGYDAINNVFGGQSEVFWGWTASTGGANNQQSFCFETAIDNTSAINETVDLVLCEGESYVSPNGNTYTTEGEFLEEFVASNGCNSIRTINIDINPVEVKLINKVICADDGYVLNGTTYTTAGQYSLTLPGVPCDTLANLTLETIDFDILISKTNDINCINNISTLQANLIDNSSFPFTGNYDYYWSTVGGNIVSGQGTDQIIVDKPGIYQLLVYTLDNLITCSFSSTPLEVLDESTPPISIISQQGLLDCTNPQAILDGSASNPGPLYFTWSTINGNIIGNNIGSILLIDQQGDYTLVVENILTGCKDTSTITVVKTSFTATAVLDKSSDLNCKNTTIDLSAAVMNGSGLNTLWSTIDGYILSDPSENNVQVTEPGTYTFTLSDNSGCTQSYSLIVKENINKPQINAGLDTVLNCLNIMLSLTGNVTSPASDYTSLWTSSGNVINNPNDLNITITDPGLYIFTVEDTINHCKSLDTVLISESINPPDIIFNAPGIFTCTIDSIKILATFSNFDPSYVYDWTTLDGQFSGSSSDSFIVATSVGNYLLNVTNPLNGCESSQLYTIGGSPDQPVAHAGPDQILDCFATSSTVTGTLESTEDPLFLTVKWSTFDGIINGVTDDLKVNATTSGHYILEVTNTINGCASRDTFEVFQSNDKPILNITDTYLITCDSITQTIIPAWSNAGINPVVTWSSVSGGIVNVILDSLVVVDMGGTYQLKVTNTQNNCLSVLDIIVNENIVTPTGMILPPDQLTCGILSVPVEFDDSGHVYLYSWFTSDGNIISAKDGSSVQVASPGSYTVLVTDPANGCSAQFNQTVEVSSDYPIVDAGMAGVLNCKVTELTLNGTVGNVSNYITTWQGINGGNIISGGNTLKPLIDHSGIYVMTVENLINQCTTSDTVSVVKNISEPEFNSPTILDANCFGKNGSISFESVENGSGPYQFKINGVSTGTGNLLFEGLNEGMYEIEGEDLNGCTFDFTATIKADGAISFLLPDSVILEFGQSYQIIPEFLFDTSGMVFNEWIGADYLDCNPCLYPTISPTYNATLTLSVTDEQGCPATEDVEIRVFKKDVNVFIPNVFSPGDHNGINDNVTVYTDISTVSLIDEFKIFNRWGAEVFSRDNFLPNDEKQGWDGYFRGKLSNPAVYVYYVKCHNIYGEALLFKGGITLVQ